MVNDFWGYHVYEKIDVLVKMLRVRGYSLDESIKYLSRHKVLSPNGQQKHPTLTQKRINEVKREIQKEYKNYN